MLRQRVREGYRSGIVAAAATAGTLIGLGRAHGASLRPLNATAHIVVGSRAYYMEGFHWLVTPVALAVHAGSVVAWGIALAALTRRLRGRRLVAASLAFAVFSWTFDYRILPDRMRPGFESGLSGMEIALVYLALGSSLGWALDRERRSADW